MQIRALYNPQHEVTSALERARVRAGKPTILQSQRATVAVDVDGDGIPDYLVSGADRDGDGIPDALQVIVK